MRRFEVRYMRRKSARSLRVWLAHAFLADTPAAGPMIGVRMLGWSVTIYPWLPANMTCKTW